MLPVKRYFLNSISAILAAILGTFSLSPKAAVSFKLKYGVDLRSANEVELKSNWQQSSLVCSGIPDMPCNITVDEAFTHLVGTFPFQLRVLNSTGITISIQSENGYLDQSTTPPFQYKRIAAGTNYTFLNQEYY
jgi:hypothetical protein